MMNIQITDGMIGNLAHYVTALMTDANDNRDAFCPADSQLDGIMRVLDILQIPNALHCNNEEDRYTMFEVCGKMFGVSNADVNTKEEN